MNMLRFENVRLPSMALCLLLALAMVGSVAAGTIRKVSDQIDPGGGFILDAEPGTIAITGDGRFLLVADGGNKKLVIIDTANFQVLTTADAASTPAHVAVSPSGGNGSEIAIATHDTSTVRRFDLSTLVGGSFRLGDTITAPSFTDPTIAGSPGNLRPVAIRNGVTNNQLLFLGGSGSARVFMTNEGGTALAGAPPTTVSGGSEIRAIAGGVDPGAGGVAPGDPRDVVYVLTDDGAGSTEVVPLTMTVDDDAVTTQASLTLSAPDTVRGAAVSRDGNQLLFAENTPDAVQIIDTSDPTGISLAASQPSTIFSMPYDVATTEDINSSPLAFVTNNGDDTVAIFDPSDASIDGDSPITLSTGASPAGITADENGYVYVANSGTDNISVITDNPWMVSGAFTPPATNDGINRSVIFMPFQDPDFPSTLSLIESSVRIKHNSDPGMTGSDMTPGGSFITVYNDGPNDTITVEASVSPGSPLVEGNNEVWVFVDDRDGNHGHYAFNLVQDIVPAKVPFSLEFGDRRFFVTFDALNEDDIYRYEIYYSVTQASLSALVNSVDSSPLAAGVFRVDVITFNTGRSNTVTVNVDPSIPQDPETGTRVYVRMRAVDDTPNYGNFGQILSVLIQKTLSFSEAAGGGGSSCVISKEHTTGVAAIPSLALLLLPLIVALPVRKRWRRQRR